MNTFSFGVSVFLEDEHHPGLTENKYKYVIAEEAEIKIMRKQEMRFRLIQRPQFFMLSVTCMTNNSQAAGGLKKHSKWLTTAQ